jgi:hypothetical protein
MNGFIFAAGGAKPAFHSLRRRSDFAMIEGIPRELAE